MNRYPKIPEDKFTKGKGKALEYRTNVSLPKLLKSYSALTPEEICLPARGLKKILSKIGAMPKK